MGTRSFNKGRTNVSKTTPVVGMIRVGDSSKQGSTSGRSNHGRKVVSEAAHEEVVIRVGKL